MIVWVHPFSTYALRRVWIEELLSMYSVRMGWGWVENTPCLLTYYTDSCPILRCQRAPSVPIRSHESRRSSSDWRTSGVACDAPAATSKTSRKRGSSAGAARATSTASGTTASRARSAAFSSSRSSSRSVSSSPASRCWPRSPRRSGESSTLAQRIY